MLTKEFLVSSQFLKKNIPSLLREVPMALCRGFASYNCVHVAHMGKVVMDQILEAFSNFNKLISLYICSC